MEIKKLKIKKPGYYKVDGKKVYKSESILVAELICKMCRNYIQRYEENYIRNLLKEWARKKIDKFYKNIKNK